MYGAIFLEKPFSVNFLCNTRLKMLIVELSGLVSPGEDKMKNCLIFQARTQTFLWEAYANEIYDLNILK